jgi:hypothetical protein
VICLDENCFLFFLKNESDKLPLLKQLSGTKVCLQHLEMLQNCFLFFLKNESDKLPLLKQLSGTKVCLQHLEMLQNQQSLALSQVSLMNVLINSQQIYLQH